MNSKVDATLNIDKVALMLKHSEADATQRMLETNSDSS